MNAGIYKLIFSKRLNALVVVGEICSSQGKAPGSTRAFKRTFQGVFQVMRILAMFSSGALLVSTAWATPANDALPTGGQVVQGSASISQSGAEMNINQGSQRAVINWQTFDVGKDAKVHILQPDQAAVLLNRVVTNKPSEIYGKIDANGQVILVNNNGIIFGQDGSASAASFTATTLDISDKDFMEGKNRFSSHGAQGEIVNQGTITAKEGGYVALLGAKVTNDGKIVAHNGAVALGAAETIAIPMTSSGKIKMQLSAGSLNAAVENTKNAVIVTEGGDVYLQAAAANNALASIKQSGQIDSSAEQAGNVNLLADNGEIKVDGHITANSRNPVNKGGDIIIGRDLETGKLAKTTYVSGAILTSDQGFVETSGAFLASDGVKVTANEWLLDPYNVDIVSDATGASGTAYSDNFTAAATSKIKASDISNSLSAGTNVTISTGIGTQDSATTKATAGDIEVLAAITKTGTTTAKLTLDANNHVEVKAGITDSSSGSGSLSLDLIGRGLAKPARIYLAGGGDDFTNSIYGGVFAALDPTQGWNGTINLKGDLTVNGTNRIVGLATGRDAGFRNDAAVTARSIKITGDTSLANASNGGIAVRLGNTLTATGGNIAITANSRYQQGFYNGNHITATGNIDITASSTTSSAVWLTGSGRIKGTAININGTAGGGYGYYADNTASLETTAGDIVINASSTGGSVPGFNWVSAGEIKAVGNISLTGTSSTISNSSHGMLIGNGTITTTTGSNGSITLNGSNSNTSGYGAGMVVSTLSATGSLTETKIVADKDVNITASTVGLGHGLQFKAGKAGDKNTVTATNGKLTINGTTKASNNNGSSLVNIAGVTFGNSGTAANINLSGKTGVDITGTNTFSGAIPSNGFASGLTVASDAIVGLASSVGAINAIGDWTNPVSSGTTGFGMLLQGTVNLSAATTSTLEGKSKAGIANFLYQGSSINALTGDLLVKGTSSIATAVQSESSVVASQGNITFDGAFTSSTGNYGVFIYNNSTSLQSKVVANNGGITINGSSSGAAAGVIVGRNLQLAGGLKPLIEAKGKIDISGVNNGTGTAVGVNLSSGDLISTGTFTAGQDAILVTATGSSDSGRGLRIGEDGINIVNNSTNGATTIRSTKGNIDLEGGSITNAATAGAISLAAGFNAGSGSLAQITNTTGNLATITQTPILVLPSAPKLRVI